MTSKSPAPDAAPAPDLDDEPIRAMTDEEEAQLDAWLLRNKDALNASIRKAREEFANGQFYTAEEVEATLEADAIRRSRKR